MKTLYLTGVRCFRDEQAIPIRPLTLLVGENSTGKSTILAMVRAAWDIANRGVAPDFNEEPFRLGGYETIAHYHGGQGKRAHHFEIRLLEERRGARREVTATFTDRAGQPALASWKVVEDLVEAKQGSSRPQRREFLVEFGDKQDVHVTAWEAGVEVLPRTAVGQMSAELPARALFMVAERALLESSPKDKARLDSSNGLLRLLWARSGDPRPVSTAPIRSKPYRTYDPRRDAPEPEGSHVPMALAALHATDRARFDDVVSAIATYGKQSGLFSKLNVKRLGQKPGDPFQLFVTVGKHAFNLTDVGYGVSQILPILFDTLTAPSGQTFLLQQPEVHLHPRAQAALGSVLASQAASRKQTFLVETHSDYVVDSVRMSVRDGGAASLSHRDVVILYFERKEGQATVHAIDLDARGNLVNAPPNYRDFFLAEERRLLGIG